MDVAKILKNNNIPTVEIQSDIEETEKEIVDFNDEKDVLMRNPPQNKRNIA